jgi:hypothetical protein
MNDSPYKEHLLREPRINRVIVCEDFNFVWDEGELTEMRKMWKKGVDIEEMAECFDRDPDEVILALMHLAKEDKIHARKHGLKGKRR